MAHLGRGQAFARQSQWIVVESGAETIPGAPFTAMPGVAITGLAIPGDADTGSGGGANVVTVTPIVAHVTVGAYNGIANPNTVYAHATVASISVQGLSQTTSVNRTGYPTSASVAVSALSATTTNLFFAYPPAAFVDVGTDEDNTLAPQIVISTGNASVGVTGYGASNAITATAGNANVMISGYNAAASVPGATTVLARHAAASIDAYGPSIQIVAEPTVASVVSTAYGPGSGITFVTTTASVGTTGYSAATNVGADPNAASVTTTAYGATTQSTGANVSITAGTAGASVAAASPAISITAFAATASVSAQAWGSGIPGVIGNAISASVFAIASNASEIITPTAGANALVTANNPTSVVKVFPGVVTVSVGAAQHVGVVHGITNNIPITIQAFSATPVVTGLPTTANVIAAALNAIYVPSPKIVFSATGHPNTPWGATILPSMWEAAIMSNWSAD